MLGRNLTGSPDARDYLLGRACVFVSPLDATSGLPGAYRQMGNTPNLAVSVDIEELVHRASLCSDQGGAVIDRRIVIQTTLNLSMTLEELSHDNVAIFLQGTVDSETNPYIAGFGPETVSTSIELERYYPISDSNGVRVFGVDATDLTVEDAAGPTTLTGGGSDYTFYSDAGLLIFHAGGANTLAGGEEVQVTVAADATAPATVETLDALSSVQQRYAVKCILENANNNNEKVELEFHSVLLTGDGDLGVIADELAQMSLTGVAEANQQLTGSPTLTISKLVDAS